MVSADPGKNISRRRLLRSAIFLSVAGVGIILGLESAYTLTTSSVSGSESNSTQAALIPSGSPITVTVTYVGMPLRITDTRKEDFTLRSPARFSDLLDMVVERHPLVSTMVPTMLISVNGVVERPEAVLTDGAEVALLPAVVGG
jgi:molybdopterin converting factor small subunit